MTELLPFFIVLFAGVFFSEIFSRLHVPWVVALIIGGILIGPSVFNIYTDGPVLNFLGDIGLVFLMFMAGLQIKLRDFTHLEKGVKLTSVLNGVIPFIVGFTISLLFGFDVLASVLVGIIFISSSVAVVIPAMQSLKLMKTPVGKSILETTILQDVASLFLLSVVIQSVAPITDLPLVVFYIAIVFFLWILKMAIPRILKLVSNGVKGKEENIRAILAILVGTVLVFEILGLHPIIAGFFAGVVVAESNISTKLKEKLNTFSYGLFIPIFFVVIGATTDLSVFGRIAGAEWLVAGIVILSMMSKFFSGYWGAKLTGHTHTESKLIGSATIPQLSTTLAVVFAGVQLGILPEVLVTAMIILSLVSTVIAPALLRKYHEELQPKRKARKRKP